MVMSCKSNLPFIFDPEAVESAIASRLNGSCGLESILGGTVSVKVTVPPAEEIPLYLASNATLKTTITITWSK